jgi:hypothetical protein
MAPRAFGNFAYAPTRRTSTLFGGIAIGAAAYTDTWEWDGSTWQQLITETSPTARCAGTSFADPRGLGMVMFSGTPSLDTVVPFNETWRLRFDSETPHETCTIDIDADGDGLKGCADPDCWARCTPLCPPGAPCPAGSPKCGDGTCDPLETCRLCPQDCGACTAACGDTFCDAPETSSTCPGDCP